MTEATDSAIFRASAQLGPTEARPLTRIQKIVGERLLQSWSQIPHVTHNDEADVTALEAMRRASPGGVSGLAYQVKAVVGALRAFPQFNASFDATTSTVILKSYFHIGVAIDTPGGLVVGVVRDCDKLSGAEITAAIKDLADKARGKGLPYAEMSGGCFTISSLGGFGGTGFTPIINAPEVAILGVSRTQERAVRGEGDVPVWRLMLPLSLSYDHRVINGADAAKFVRHLAASLADPASLGID
jgi:pyruvate dehydrogenase E2 component (dihydrolipoamide acetyltransferase)